MSHPKTLQGPTDSETRAVTPTRPLVTPKRNESPQNTTGLDGQRNTHSHPNEALSHPNMRFFPTVRGNTRGARVGGNDELHRHSMDIEKDTNWGDSGVRDGQSTDMA